MQFRRFGVLVVAFMIVGATLVVGGRSAVAGDPCYNVHASSRGVTTSGSVVSGTARADTIYVEGDDYIIKAGSGNDLICVSGENNVVYGGAGRDAIYGQASAYGEAGNDYINVSNSAVADGGPGNDVIYFEFVDVVHGGSGGDWIRGYGALEVYGDSGADKISVELAELVDCGTARDSVDTDDVDVVVNCERVLH